MQNFDLLERLVDAALWFPVLLFSLCFHEYAHGWVARRRGDNTAELMGRLTLNPQAHADPIGTYLMPLLGIILRVPLLAWAKPVPVNERNLRHPRNDMFWIALAGPLSNVVLALIGTVILFLALAFIGTGSGTGRAINELLTRFLYVNAMLAVFNMIPIHPLDGGKVLARFLPENANRWLEENQVMISMVFLMLMFSGALAVVTVPAYYVAGLLELTARMLALKV